jgi:hypothetical protein
MVVTRLVWRHSLRNNVKSYDDLSDERTAARQHETMLALRRNGLGHLIYAEFPEIRLDSKFCQWRARDQRRDLQHLSLDLLRPDRKTRSLLTVTWVPEDGLRPMPVDGGLLPEILVASAALGATGWVGATEFDFDVGQGSWRETVHAVMSVPANTKPKVFSKRLKALLSRPDTREKRIYRPVVVKPVTHLEGAIRYVFKNLAILSTTQRVTWLDSNGKPRRAKQRLKPAQLQQLLNQAEHGAISRFAIETLGEVS